jgi:hypothetical protein
MNVQLPLNLNANLDAEVLRVGTLENTLINLKPRERTRITEKSIRAKAGSGGAPLSFMVGDGTLKLMETANKSANFEFCNWKVIKLIFLSLSFFIFEIFFMTIKSDLWLRRMAEEQEMIQPFLPEHAARGERRENNFGGRVELRLRYASGRRRLSHFFICSRN